MNNPLFNFPEYLLPDILDNLRQTSKVNFQTLQTLRSVSTTWRDYTDRVFFRKIVLTAGNFDAFIDWITAPATDNDKTKGPSVQTPVIVPKCRDILRFVSYVKILIKRVANKEQYRVKIKEALMSLPNLRGAVYGDRFDHQNWMILHEALIDVKEQLTHLDISCRTFSFHTPNVKEVEEVNRHSMRFFKNSLFPNLRVVNLDFGYSRCDDFNFGVLKYLVKVDIMAVCIRHWSHPAPSLVDLLRLLPKSLRWLKLAIPAIYAVNCASSNTFHRCQLRDVVKLHVIFTGGYDAQHGVADPPDIVLQMQRVLSWVFPNVNELKMSLGNKWGCTGLVGSMLTYCEWRSMLLTKHGIGLTNLFLEDGIALWNGMREVWEAPGRGGNPCRNLECITLLLSADKNGYNLPSTANETRSYFDRFVDSLPWTVTQIQVSDEIEMSVVAVGMLVAFAGRRGIVVSVGKFTNPSTVLSYRHSF
ncbi:hypothetical protein HDU76_003995 [Blyttiomyces sp. JEL0837]|nr:hypothetical protein HDU76_003995 [Blyttiomyces sp. JEL0837]